MLRRSLVGLICLVCLPVFAHSTPEKLHDLFDRVWEAQVQESPLFATSIGRHELDHLLPSATEADFERRIAKTKAFLEELDGLDRNELSDQDKVNFDMFRSRLVEGLDSTKFREQEMPINADSGFHVGFADMPNEMPLRDRDGYEDYISRLNAMPRYFGEQIALMRKGLERGFTVPQVVLEGYDKTISSLIADTPEESLFWRPFTEFPVGVLEAEREPLRKAGRIAVEEGALAAYRAFLDFFQNEYQPGARKTLGASDLPDGEAFYQHQIRSYTSLDLSPQEIHDIGRSEVKRIRAEMDTIIEEVGFEGDFAAFLNFLRTDPRFYPKSGDELLKEASYIAKKMDAKLPSLFKTLPRLPYGVEPVPDHLAPKYTAGRYYGAPKGSTRAGTYWVNVYDLPSRTLYTLEALTLHEAVPGHHLQISLSHELEDLPNFRRYSYISAFGEGWGLYSEWLGLEAGFYKDPYSNFGRLTYEMWRACRLVVDTGVHAFGWTRQQVLDFLGSNTALSLHEVTTETDRYISWPGQALAYKLGELKIKELRRKAEAALGEHFDIREFHDAILLNGAVPLPVLEDQIDTFIQKTQSAQANSTEGADPAS